MKIAIAQINCIVGDIDGNVERIRTAIAQAQTAAADLLLTPELSLCGYSPQDLLQRDDFIAACACRLDGLARESGAMAVVVGHPGMAGGQLFNCASVLRGGRVEATYHKQCLPNHGAFDEMRYFAAGTEPLVIPVDGTRVGLLVCADAWEAAPAIRAREAGADILAVINASPWHLGKPDERREVAGDRVADTGLGLVYANLIGGGDDLVFDGASFAMDHRGEIIGRLPAFSEAFAVIEVVGRRLQPGPRAACPTALEAMWLALVLGVRDYAGKNGYAGALVDLSCSAGAALVLTIAVEALGADAVLAALPAAAGREDACAIAGQLGVQTLELPLEPTLAALAQAVGTDRADFHRCAAGGLFLAALARRQDRLLLSACDKTQYALGALAPGREGLAVLADVCRTDVQALLRLRSSQDSVFPAWLLDRPALPPWPVEVSPAPANLSCEMLDAIITAYVERDLPADEIAAAGLAPALVARVIDCIDRAERFRRQAPPGIKVTARTFGRDRRYPASHQYRQSGPQAAAVPRGIAARFDDPLPS